MDRAGSMGGRGAIRVLLTAVMAWLAFVLLLPGETFRTAVSFRVMAGLGAEWQWAACFAVIAGIGIVGIATRSVVVWVACGLCVAMMHGLVALCLVLANPWATGSGTYGFMAYLGYYLVWGHTHEGI